eukprot:SAG31_NODE_1005_length_10432_cov_16.909909_11_plen_83_part_00
MNITVLHSSPVVAVLSSISSCVRTLLMDATLRDRSTTESDDDGLDRLQAGAGAGAGAAGGAARARAGAGVDTEGLFPSFLTS